MSLPVPAASELASPPPQPNPAIPRFPQPRPPPPIDHEAETIEEEGGSVRWKGFLAGTASGLTKLAIGHPFDIIKVRGKFNSSLKIKVADLVIAVQCSQPGTYNGPIDVVRKTIRHEGWRAFYKGWKESC